MPTFTYLSLALALAVTGLILTDNFALQTVFLLRYNKDVIIIAWTKKKLILP
jgi:hypothetical protein